MAYTPIDKSDDYFNTVIWTGNDTSPRTITGVNFQPDFTWTKRRDNGDGNTNHNLYNSIVGAGNNTELVSNGTFLEGGSSCNLYGYLSAFTSDGFTLTDGTDGTYEDLYTNQSGATYVSWNWLAANGTASNTDGSITSTVSANTTSGFSIVSYTGNFTAGATVGHGLGVVPSMYIIKNRDRTEPWMVYHQSLGNTKALYLNTTNAQLTSSVYTNNTSPTSSVFSLGGWEGNNGSSEDLIAYCFAEKKGFSKFGSYTGNGSSNGPFVYLGFKPAFFMMKRTDSTGEWKLVDNKRFGYNPSNRVLVPSSSAAEQTDDNIFDIVSNGIKIRNSGAALNASGGSFIYMAFAENPFVTSTGIAGTAR